MSSKTSRSTVLTWLAGLALAALAVVACTREDYEPDPKPQTLVPCHPGAADDDPLACPPDAAIDAPVDAATDAASIDGTAATPSDAPPDM